MNANKNEKLNIVDILKDAQKGKVFPSRIDCHILFA